MGRKDTLLIIFITFISLALAVYFLKIQNNLFFSDTAKFADVARNLVNGKGYVGGFNFFLNTDLSGSSFSAATASWISPMMPLSIAGFFKIFGVSDASVIATSFFFFFLSILSTFLLGRKLFGKLVGVLSALVVAFNTNLLEYAKSGASESLFIFEIVFAAYLFTIRKKWTDIAGFIFLVLMYFTRPQAFIYIAGLLLYYLLLNFKTRKALTYFTGVIALGLLVDLLILTPLAGRYFLTPIIGRGINATSQVAVGASPSDMLRGSLVADVAFVSVLKKAFYNLYNFYKLLPQIMSPYLAAFFVLGLFIREKSKVAYAFKWATLFMVILTFLVTALTIPFFRYLHPVVPLVYIFAIATIVKIVRQVAVNKDFGFTIYGLKVPNKTFINLVSLFLILTFGVGQTMGVLLLDSRFERNTKNVDKPPVYVQLSWKLKEITQPDEVVITNLDTWGSWYGERRTVWFPLEPDMLDPGEGKDIPFDAIYLTNYLMDDSNYYMGEAWRQVFENPTDIQNEFLRENYEFAGEHQVLSSETYERMEGRAVLLRKK